MSAPPTSCTQNADGLSLTFPASRYTRPMISVRAYVQLPPDERRSIRKSQTKMAETSRMSGKRKRRRSSEAAASTSSSNASRDHDQPLVGEPLTPFQPHHMKSVKTKTAHAITD